MDIPDKYLNKAIYRKAKALADKTYERHSAYKSMFLTKKYLELGGKYKTPKKESKLSRWREEKWIKILPYLLEGKEVVCGSGGKDKHSCRPLKRINKDTPMTISELIKKHGKRKLVSLAKKKAKNMDIRINWEEGKEY